MSQIEAPSLALSLGEAAREVRVSPRHLRRMIANGEGPNVVRLGGRAVIRRGTLDEWLKAREERAAS